MLYTVFDDYSSWDFISFTEPEYEPSMALLIKLGYKNMGYLSAMESQVLGKWTTPITEAEIAQAVTDFVCHAIVCVRFWERLKKINK